ncbi:MAG: hypothetical protein ABI999_11300, partial [Acidobacteriota bacterium]
MGRELPDLLKDPYGLDDQEAEIQPIHLKGINNQDLSYSIVWKKLEDSFENSTTQLKYVGQDTCISVGMHPVNGSSLFKNADEYVHIETPDDSSIRYVENQRACNGAIQGSAHFNPVVMAEFIQPNGQKYTFKYNEYGEITRIDYPTGGYERFEYQVIKSVGEVVDGVYEQANRGVQKKYVSVDGTTEIETTYEQFNNGTDYAIRTIAADQTKTERVLYRSNDSGFGFDDPRSGVPKEERAFDSSGKLASRTLTDLIVTPPQGSGAVSIATRDPRPATTVSITIENGKALASMSEISYETPGENGSSAPTDLRYFARSNVRQTLSYHFLPISNSVAESGTITDFKNLFHQSGHVSSISQSDYVYDENYMKRGISSLPSETRVLNPLNPNDVLSKTQTVFDDPAGFVADSPSLSGAVANSWINPTADPTIPVNSRNVRGKPTSMKLWLSEESRWLESKTQYDQYGNVRKAWDSSGDNARFTETEYSSLFSSAYPTKVITPAPNPDNTHGTNQTSVVETTYDFTTGLALSVKDDFGRVSTTEYDAALRPIRVNPIVVNGGPTGPKSEMVYGQPDSNGQFQPSERFVKTRKQLDANNWDEATTWFDALGRTIKTQAKDSQGDVFVETHYDDFGRVDRVTNPYRGGETVYWSKTRYDELGRAVEAFAPEPLSNLANAKSLGITSFDISTVPGNFGTVVETKDAANKRSRSITNALGQLIVVEEADSGGNLKPLPESTPLPVPSPTATPTPGPTPTPTPIPTPTPGGGGSGGGGGHGCVANCPQSLVPSDFPSYATYYTYNVQGKLVQVTQGDQNRYFKYDSLGRLIRVSQPEQQYNQNLDLSDYYNLSGHWTAGFTYDVLGNVISATDAKGTVITNTYDKANRVTARTYSNEPVGVTTPAVNFFYDGKGLDTLPSPNFAKGKLTKVENGVSQTRYTQFDNFGRLVSTEQRTPLDGQTIANATPYVSSYQYNLSGALVQETYPSGRVVKNEFESDGDLANVTSKAATSTIFRPYVSDFSYTAAGGITQMKLGNGRYETAKFNNRLQVTELGLGNSATDASLWKTNYDYGELDGSGNVDATKNTGNIAKQTLTVPGASFVQSYNYDSLYRLTQAKETSSSTQNWIQNWSYDRYGNRTNFTQNVAGLAGGTAPAVDPNTNRFTDTSFHYDKNGNVVQDVDPVSSHNRQF